MGSMSLGLDHRIRRKRPMKTHQQTYMAPRPRSPSVSIVIPALNSAATLVQALASVQGQDVSDWEAIIVDDGSTDSTASIANLHALHDGRVRCVPGPCRGTSAARNTGIARARGEFIAFLDADDLWLPHKLRMHLCHLARAPQVGVSFDRVLFITEEGRPTGTYSTRRVHRVPPHEFLYENPACTSSTLVIRREALVQSGGFDEGMRCAEDLELLMRMHCTTAWGVEGLDEVLTFYRADPQGIPSSSFDAMQADWEVLIDKVRAYAPELASVHYRAIRAVHLRYLARRALRLGLPANEGLRMFFRAVASSPLALLRDPRRTFGTLAGLLAYGAVPSSFLPNRR
jgi:glycosyltransferase involved in cell wall biosynthesis